MDTKWVTSELAWTTHPETGVSLEPAPVLTSKGYSQPQPHRNRGCSPAPSQSWLHLPHSLPCSSSRLVKPSPLDSVPAEQEHHGPWPGLLLVTLMTQEGWDG